MRKRNKITWGKLWPYFLTEIAALVLAGLLVSAVYSLTDETVRKEIDGYVSGLDKIEYVGGDGNILTRVRDLRNTLYYDDAYDDCYVVSILYDCFDAEGYRENDGQEQGIVTDGLYLEGTIVYLKARFFEEDEYRSASLRRERLWDLTKYFSKEEIEKLVDFIQIGRETSFFLDNTVEEVRGREKEDGHFIITGMTVSAPGTLELRSKEYKASDMILPTGYLTKDGRQGTVSLSLVVEKQNAELCGKMEWFRVEGEEDSRYYMKTLNYCDPYYTWLGKNQRIREIQEASNGEVSYLTTGADATVPNAVLYVMFDRGQIVWNKAGRKILCTVLFVQCCAVIAMIILHVGLRKREEQRKLRDTFVNAMAHELKTPAAVVRNTAEYLATGAKPEKQGHYIDVLTRESDSMDTMLNRMLTYTQVLDGKVELHPVETDWNSLTDKVIDSYSDLITERHMTVTFSVRTEEKPVCDPDLIGMVIDNLISNAVRHGEPGSTIIVQTVGQRFMVWNKADPLTDAELEKLWTPMFQTERRSKDSETGGMGLAISAGILDRHGATYGAYNQNDGLLFRFDFTKAKENTKNRRYAWVFLPLAGMWLLLAANNGMRYASGGNTDDLILMCLQLAVGIAQTAVYALNSRLGKKRIRKRKS